MSQRAMSMPAQAKLPVPARNCQSPCVKASRRIASRFQGSRPSTKGAIAFSAASTDAVSAPQQASPQPTRPSSVVSFTSTSLTPSRATCELTSRCLYGMLTGIVSSLSILTCRVWQSRPFHSKGAHVTREAIVGTAVGGPYSPAVVAEGKFVFVAGQGPLRNGEYVPGSIEEETRLTLENLGTLLEQAASG